jgi:RNA polymerase sigma-19 factor, ECF subfamily
MAATVQVIGNRKQATARPLELDETPSNGDAARRSDGPCPGDVAALQGLMDAYWRPLLNYATRILGDRDTAEDTVQEAFIRLWERRGEWKADSPARIVLYTIVRNLALNGRKSARVRDRSDVRLRLPRPAPLTAPEDALQADELTRALQAAIDSLPPRRREILLLSRFDSLSRHEIADLLGLAPQTVANHLALVLAELRVKLRSFLSPA